MAKKRAPRNSGAIVTGSVVRLKSGGPWMTVEGIADSGKVQCVWFDEGTAKEYRFNRELLKVAPEQT